MLQIPEILKKYISDAIKILWDLNLDDNDILISHTPSPQIGHKASSVAFVLSKKIKKSPMLIAQELALALEKHSEIDKIEAVNGYINLFFKPEFLIQMVQNLLTDTSAYSFKKQNQKVHLEFISANPTGPLHIGHGRWAILGDSLARILTRVGYEVFREFYVNDAGNQIQKLKESVDALKNNQPIPEDGYHGEYLKDLLNTNEEPVLYFRKQHESLIKSIGVHMDHYYSEKSLIENKEIYTAIAALKEKGLIYEQEGATFFASTTLGDDKDRALIKSDGTFTYFAPDIAYHYTKIKSGAHWIIDILGADHHGYIKRMAAAVASLSNNQVKFDVLLGQLVNLLKNGEPVKMSKRAGNIVSLQEVVDEIGVDALRIVLLSKKFNHTIDFDLEILKTKNKENPLFYIQYAYARIHSIFETIGPLPKEIQIDTIPTELDSTEINLLLHAFEYRNIIQLAQKEMDPYYLYAYIYELATLFHKFYEKVRIKEQDDIIIYRVPIIKMVAQILLDASKLLGISMPEKI